MPTEGGEKNRKLGYPISGDYDVQPNPHPYLLSKEYVPQAAESIVSR